jgi:hypothetical protein
LVRGWRLKLKQEGKIILWKFFGGSGFHRKSREMRLKKRENGSEQGVGSALNYCESGSIVFSYYGSGSGSRVLMTKYFKKFTADIF